MKADPNSSALLLAIARHSLQRDPDAIRKTAQAVSDWPSFVAMARAHRMAPMAYQCLEEALAAIPAATHEQLAADYERNLCQSTVAASELLAVLAAFEHEQIRTMPFKGIVLAASAYPSLEMRACGDLDLLICVQDLDRANAVLRARGFGPVPAELRGRAPAEPGTDLNHEDTLLRPRDGMIVELRWKLDFIYGRYGRDLGLEWAWQGHHMVQVTGAAVPCMSPEKNLLMLCMHASRHIWSRLLWICDVAHLIASSPELDWDSVENQARALGLWKPLALGVLLAQRLLGSPMDCPLLPSMQQDRTILKLVQHFEKHVLTMPGVGPAGRLPYNLLLLDLRDRMRVLFTPSIFKPNERDRAALNMLLPQPLYYLVRPFRILLDRSSR